MTDRARNIVALFAAGVPIKKIADELGITEKTVEYHLSKTMARNRIPDRIRMVHWALNERLLPNAYALKVIRPPSQNRSHSWFAIRRLAHIGENYLTNDKKTTIYQAARRAGIRVSMRRVSKTEYRVWRTDGLPWHEVDKIIEARKAK